MQFQVPQFTDTENKVIGPLTVRQALWFGVGGLAIFIMSYILTAKALLIFSIIVLAICCAFAFAKIQNVSLAKYLLYALKYFLKIEKYSYTTDQKNEYLPEEKHNIKY